MRKPILPIKREILLILIYIIISTPIFSQIDIFTPQESIITTKDSVEQNKPIELSTINNEIEYTDNLITKFNISSKNKDEFKVLINRTDIINNYIIKQGEEFNEFESTKLSSYFLKSAQYTWQRYYNELRTFQIVIQKKIRETQINQHRFTKNNDKWEKNLPSLKPKVSYHILNRINKNKKASSKIIRDYNKQINSLLEIENNILENVIYTERILSEINELIETKQKEMFKKTNPSIISLDYKDSFQGSFGSRIELAYYENTKTFTYFYKKIKDRALIYFLVILVIIGYLVKLRRDYLKLGYDNDTPGFKKVQRTFTSKILYISITILLLAWLMIIHYTPLFVARLIYLAILAMMLIIVSDSFDKRSKQITITMITLLALNNIELFAWYFGDYSRLYVLFETILAIALITPFLLRKDKDAISNKHSLLYYTNIIAPIAIILFTTSFFANIFGLMNLAIYTLSLTINLGTITIIAFSSVKIFKSILIASVETLKLKYSNFITNNEHSIITKGNKIINISLFLLWAYALLQISEVLSFFNSKFSSILTSGISIGNLSFRIGDILLFVGILYLSISINKFIKSFIEREVLAKKELKRGSAAAISLTARMLILFLGFTVALSAAGMDMTRISIIAGALSVGIGFGLQNIVGNFVSGLILIYEKPLQEGDTIEVGTLLGRVTNIGIRASNVVTYDGAEVVVPNTNLVSNDLINWTLSDNKKRMETLIGVKYGSDPNQVIELLTEVCKNHPKILPYPNPVVLFVGFGDSSLDFRVLFWVSFEDGIQTRSDINVGIYNSLAENNIEIPFPQIDLHVKDILGEDSDKKKAKKVNATKSKKVITPKKDNKQLDLDTDATVSSSSNDSEEGSSS